MIKFAGILLTLCATSLVVINIRTLETVETSPDDRPALIDTCLVARSARAPPRRQRRLVCIVPNKAFLLRAPLALARVSLASVTA